MSPLPGAPGPIGRLRSLRGRFLLLVIGIYAVVGALAVVGFVQISGKIIRSLGAGYATQYANQQKGNILAKIEREVVLAQKLVDSPLLRKWSLDETNGTLKALALEELESYRRLFADRSYFFVVGASRDYYFNNDKDEFRGKELRYTIQPGDPTTAWYFATMDNVADFALHVDNSEQLGVTKVWINAIVKDGDRKIGLGGSGLDLTAFLKAVVKSPEAGVETVLVDGKGFVQGHSNERLMEENARIRDESRRLKVFGLLDGEVDRERLREELRRLSSGASTVTTFETRAGGRHMLAAAAYLPSVDWAAVVFVDPVKVVRTRQFLPVLLLLAASLLATILLVSWTLDRLILVRLARLSASTREIAAGRYDVHLEVDRPDEIGHLTRSFNHMTATIRDYTQNLERKVEGRTHELQEANGKLEAVNRKVMDSIRYARLIQSALLARPADLAALLPDSALYWRPRDVVGGDFYALYPDGAGGFLLAVADCTGHGVPGAFMTMAAKALLDRAVASRGMDDPAALLADLDRTVRTLLQQEGPGSHHGLDLALVRAAPGASTLRFAGGKLGLWIQAPDGSFRVLKGDRRSLGYADSEAGFVFTNHEHVPEPGERYFVLTDGILDQAGGVRGFGLGHRRLQEALAAWRDVPMTSLADRIERLLLDYQGNYPQRDDITLVGFRLTAGPGAAREKA